MLAIEILYAHSDSVEQLMWNAEFVHVSTKMDRDDFSDVSHFCGTVIIDSRSAADPCRSVVCISIAVCVNLIEANKIYLLIRMQTRGQLFHPIEFVVRVFGFSDRNHWELIFFVVNGFYVCELSIYASKVVLFSDKPYNYGLSRGHCPNCTLPNYLLCAHSLSQWATRLCIVFAFLFTFTAFTAHTHTQFLFYYYFIRLFCKNS